MKAKDLLERTDRAPGELEKSLAREIFDAPLQELHRTGSTTPRASAVRRDLARVKTILTSAQQRRGRERGGKA
jgi:ribosomal protein L29